MNMKAVTLCEVMAPGSISSDVFKVRTLRTVVPGEREEKIEVDCLKFAVVMGWPM